MDSFIGKVRRFAMRDPRVESAIVIGSYARGTHTETSDLDLCIITASKNEMIEAPEFIREFGTPQSTRTEYYGACTSIRVWYENGPEVEFGIVEPSWISQPLDAGTRKALSGGYTVIADKKNYFQNLKI